MKAQHACAWFRRAGILYRRRRLPAGDRYALRPTLCCPALHNASIVPFVNLAEAAESGFQCGP